MRTLLAIDPGYTKSGQGCACAALVLGRLHAVWFERPPADAGDLECPLDFGLVVVEKPQADGRTQGINPTVVIELAWVGAALGGLYAGRDGCGFKGATVSAWKNSVPKPVHHKRLWHVLEDSERALLGGPKTLAVIEVACTKGALDRWGKPGVRYYPKSFETHNLLDAVALGMHALGRFK